MKDLVEGRKVHNHGVRRVPRRGSNWFSTTTFQPVPKWVSETEGMETCTRVFVWEYMHTSVHTWVCVYMKMCTCVMCTYARTYVGILYVCVCVYERMHMCICTCVTILLTELLSAFPVFGNKDTGLCGIPRKIAPTKSLQSRRMVSNRYLIRVCVHRPLFRYLWSYLFSLDSLPFISRSEDGCHSNST